MKQTTDDYYMAFLAAIIAVVCVMLATQSCTTVPVQETPAPKVFPQQGWFPEYEQMVTEGFTQMPDLTANMTIVCPKWKQVDQSAVWVKLWKSVIDCESGFNRASFFQEPASGFPNGDKVTGLPVASQGLLSLSYQDVNSYPSAATCKKFDWSKDKALPRTSLDATINDGLTSLGCAMEIANASVIRNPHYWANEPTWTAFAGYWSCIRPGHDGYLSFKQVAKECQ